LSETDTDVGTLKLLAVTSMQSLSSEGVGGAKRNWNLIKGLERNGIAVTLWSYGGSESFTGKHPDQQPMLPERVVPGRMRRSAYDKVRALVSPLPEEMWLRPKPRGPWAVEIAQHDAVIFLGSATLGLLHAARLAARPTVLDNQDVPHVLIGRIAATMRGRIARWRMSLDAHKWRRAEAAGISECDLVGAVSETDAAIFRSLANVPVVVRPNGVDLEAYAFTDHAVPRAGQLLMTGDFSYLPNVDAVRWLTGEIMPRVRADRPDTTLHIVGRHAASGSSPGVRASADVPEIQPFFDEADLFVAPLRAGSGTRIKIVEAMAKGLPCVTTRVGAEGLPVENGVHLLLADTTDELVAAVLRLLDDTDLRARLAKNGRSLVEEQLGWDRITDDYAADIFALAGARAKRM
jgi:glycosyltransferase involved in cell wall biosynthesis